MGSNIYFCGMIGSGKTTLGRLVARRLIVDGAVGMVKDALTTLEESGVVKLDDERRAAMVNNLLVSLVSESQAQPVINTGTLYA